MCLVGFARRAASRTRLAKPACGLLCELSLVNVIANPGARTRLEDYHRKLGARPCLARRAALRTRRANLMCASSRLANPGARPCLASRSCESRRANPSCALSRFAKPPCELLPNVRRRQDFAVVRSWAAVRGNILARCVPRWPSVAIFRRGAFPGGYPWQYSRFMHPRRGLGREKRPFLATYRRHVSKTSWLWQDMRAMYPKSPANRLSGMHSAQILPERGPFRRTGPSNHT